MRLERIQAAAQVWLGVLTTLLGLLGSVVLFKGGDLVTEITANSAFVGVLIGLVGLVFASAVLAVITGGVATWGGLRDPSSATGGVISHVPKWHEPLLNVVLRVGLTPEGDREAVRTAAKEAAEADPDPAAGFRWQAERNRIYLHASRSLGVVAAGFIAVLAIVAVIAGTYFPAPSEVVLVHHGMTSCVSASKKYSGVTWVVPVNSC
jgi:hypothetical protein